MTKVKQEEIILSQVQDSDDSPAMLSVFTDSTYQQAFVFALAVEKNPQKRAYDSSKLLVAIIAGADAATSSIKASLDVGGSARFGIAKKTNKNYMPGDSLLLVGGEKGAYQRVAMPVVGLPNAIGIIHNEVATNEKYVISMNDEPERVIGNLFGTAFNLHLLEEWHKPVFEKLQSLDYIKEVDMYVDRAACPDLKLYSIDMTEEQADMFIGDMLKSGDIKFPYKGEGSKVGKIESLTDYLVNFSEPMAEKITQQIKAIHDPMVDSPLAIFDNYKRPLFPVQAHAATALAKKLAWTKDNAIIQGEMSTGKSAVMTAVTHGYAHLKGKKGYFAALICPPSLTVKWPKEIKYLIPDADVRVIKRTEDFVHFHTEWLRNGKPKPTKPTFFIFSFTTLRNDSANVPVVEYEHKFTKQQMKEGTVHYREGYICPDCGKPHQVVVSRTRKMVDNVETFEDETRVMGERDFGTSRRIHPSTKYPPNAFCYHCGASLWSKKTITTYKSFGEFNRLRQQPLVNAIETNDTRNKLEILNHKSELKGSTSFPRRVAAAEYMRRRCKQFFDISVVDELHELKGGKTAQGQGLHSLVKASKKIIAGTGTLFGGKASDIFYLLFRLFGKDFKNIGISYKDVTQFVEQYGNLERTEFIPDENASKSNSHSRGSSPFSTRTKEIPGYTPQIFPAFLMKHVVNVRLKDVWPDPVELVDTPTIFVEMLPEQKVVYDRMIRTFEDEINSREDGKKLYTQMIDYGVSYPDNPIGFPSAYFNNKETGERELIWEAEHLSADITYPKEEMLQKIVTSEVNEERACIVYVSDTGSSNKDRDVRQRVKLKLEEIGAKVCILDTTTVAPNRRSEWLEKKIVDEAYDVCIVNQELVKVGLDLLCTPTLIYDQLTWSLYTLQQSSRRAWRIGQTQECRLFYLAYADTYQQYMAELLAKKMKATNAINGGDASSDGLASLLGSEEEDLQSMLLKSIKSGKKLDGVAEDWINQATERSRELLSNIGNSKLVERRKKVLSNQQVVAEPEEVEPNLLEMDDDYGDSREDLTTESAADIAEVFEVKFAVSEAVHVATEEIKSKIISLGDVKNKKMKSKKISDDQLVFDLFA